MSMTSRTSGTRRLERAAAMRMIAPGGRTASEGDSGRHTGSLVYSAESPVNSRDFRYLQEINLFFPPPRAPRYREFQSPLPLVAPSYPRDPTPRVVRTNGAHTQRNDAHTQGICLVYPTARWETRALTMVSRR